MSLADALRLTEVLLALAVLQQSFEHLRASPELRPLFGLRIVLAAALVAGLWPVVMLCGLLGLGIVLLHRFDGPYNGGSDRLCFLALLCLTVARLVPDWAELALGYLALQVILSYLVSGWVKAFNPFWRNGHALADVFRYSVYPVSEDLRRLAGQAHLMRAGSRGVILFELAFPLGLLHPVALGIALTVGAAFHLANAVLFGLNRFLWVWISTYPVLLWFQARLFA